MSNFFLDSRRNNRRYHRYIVDIDGYYFFSLKWNKCRIYDISQSGACLRVQQIFLKNDIIKLRLLEELEFVIRAKVVDINGTRVGIEFENLSEDDEKQIMRIIKDYRKKSTN